LKRIYHYGMIVIRYRKYMKKCVYICHYKDICMLKLLPKRYNQYLYGLSISIARYIV